MLARYIHENSLRANKPFVPVDCSSLSDALFESELFGHLKGSFTGANPRFARFHSRWPTAAPSSSTKSANSVSTFNPKLLRVLQERRCSCW